MEWFYAEADEHVGPVSDVQMRALVRSGDVAPDTLVWRDGMASWLPARQVFDPTRTPPPLPQRTPPVDQDPETEDAAISGMPSGGQSILGEQATKPIRVRAKWPRLSFGVLMPDDPSEVAPDASELLPLRDPTPAETRPAVSGVRIALVCMAILGVTVAWATGINAYHRSKDAQAQVAAFAGLVQSTDGTDFDALLKAGEAAQGALPESSRLAETFGPQGEPQVRRLAEAYAAYQDVAGGETARTVEEQRSKLSNLERQAESAQASMEQHERRTFMVSRQFDRSASGARLYDAFDMTGTRRVVLQNSSSVDLSPTGIPISLYVDDLGEEPVTMTVSNAFQSREQVEYLTVYRVAQSVDEHRRQVQEVGAGLDVARASMEEMEATYAERLQGARQAYQAAAGPAIGALRAAR